MGNLSEKDRKVELTTFVQDYDHKLKLPHAKFCKFTRRILLECMLTEPYHICDAESARHEDCLRANSFTLENERSALANWELMSKLPQAQQIEAIMQQK